METDENARQTGASAEGGDVVIVVDDYGPALTAAELALEPLGLRIISCMSGAAALDALLHLKGIRAIVTDLRMKDLSGAELAKRVRATAGLQDVPVVITSGVDPDNTLLLRTLALPAVQFVAKPYSGSTLCAAVESALTAVHPLTASAPRGAPLLRSTEN